MLECIGACGYTGRKRTMNVFIDTCVVNRVLDLKESRPDPKWEEDRKYLIELQRGPVALGIIKLFVNPSVMAQVKATKQSGRREALLSIAKEFKFTEFNIIWVKAYYFRQRFLVEIWPI